MVPSLLMESLGTIWNMLDSVTDQRALAGGLAVSYWGYPRSTRDIDIAILVDPIQTPDKLNASLRSIGLSPKKRPEIQSLGFIKVSQWQYAVPDAHIDIDLDLLLGDSKYFQQALSRRVACELIGVDAQLTVLSCEDLILFKLAAGRLLDLADVRELRERNKTTLDEVYLSTWTTELQLN